MGGNPAAYMDRLLPPDNKDIHLCCIDTTVLSVIPSALPLTEDTQLVCGVIKHNKGWGEVLHPH